MAGRVSFSQRMLPANSRSPIDGEVPRSARVAVIHVLNRMVDEQRFEGWSILLEQARYAARQLPGTSYFERAEEVCVELVLDMPWQVFYDYLEQVYGLLVGRPALDQETGAWETVFSIADSQTRFTNQINQVLSEENLCYELRDGEFCRRGRPHTQRALGKASLVLADPRFGKSLRYYRKALGFFNRRPQPDAENCVKEAVCAMEAAAVVLLGKQGCGKFETLIQNAKGTSADSIPPTLAESMLKLWAFRGAAEGVAHGSVDGGIVGACEAEAALSLVAAYITYLNDKFSTPEELPF